METENKLLTNLIKN